MIAIIFCLFFLTTLASLSTNLWLSKWTDRSKKEDPLSTNGTSSSISKIKGLTIYSILGCSQGKKSKKQQIFFSS